MKILKNIAVSDSGFLFNPATGESYSLNPIGLEIIELIKKNMTEQEICSTLLERYDTEAGIVERDIHDFLHLLRQNQLLDSNGAENC
jgi:PqqD family protein of HPr-rel-A system